MSLADLPSATAAAKELIADCSVHTASTTVTARANSIDTEFSRLAQENSAILTWWDKTPFGEKKKTASVPLTLPTHPASPRPTLLAPPNQPSTTAPPVPDHTTDPPSPSSRPAPTAALPSRRVAATQPHKQESGRQNQYKPNKPGPSTCSYCKHCGHTEAECCSKLHCDFCNLKGHTSDTCLWKKSVDKTNTLEQEVKTLLLEVRQASQRQSVPQTVPQLASNAQAKRFYYPHQQWVAPQWAPPFWPQSTSSTHYPTNYTLSTNY